MNILVIFHPKKNNVFARLCRALSFGQVELSHLTFNLHTFRP